MLIGIDASRAFSSFIGGPENYSYYLIREILKLKSNHRFRLYLRSDSVRSPRFRSFFSGLPIPPQRDLTPLAEPALAWPGRAVATNYQLRTISWPFLWTQGGLALECFLNPPDILFVPAHTIPILRRSSLKTLVTVHDLGAEFLPNYHKFPQKYYLNFATEYALKNATKIIAVSEYTKRAIEECVERSTSNVERVYEGYERDVFYPRSEEEARAIKEKYRIPGDYLLFVGTIQPRKNLVRLIEAFANVVQSSTFNVGRQASNVERSRLCLVLAGSPGWLNGQIFEAPKRLGVGELVKFLGQVPDEDLPALMSGCRAFVFPSLYEGFGLSLLEAMACGAPSVTSNVTSLPEIGGQAVGYVDPEDLTSIREGIRKVLDLRVEEREKMSREVRRQAEKFSWENSAKDILAIIEGI